MAAIRNALLFLCDFSPVSSRSALLAVLLFTAILRGGVLWVMRENLSEDRDSYRRIAENLASYQIFGLGDGIQRPRPTAYRPPLYPVMLAKIAGEGMEATPLRVAMLHWGLGMGTVWLTWVVARKFLSTGSSFQPGVSAARSEPGHTLPCAFASLLVACDPILLNWSTYVMTETLAAFLAILALYTLVRFHFDRRPMNAGFVGCAMGLAILCRPTFLPWAAACGVGLLVLQASGGRKPPDTSAAAGERLLVQSARRIANLATLVIVATVVVFPWGYRNHKQFGKPIITTTHGGYTLYLGNNRFFYHHLQVDQSGVPWDPTGGKAIPPPYEIIIRPQSFAELVASEQFDASNGPRRRAGNEEIVFDEIAYEGTRREFAAQPLMFAYSSLYRVAQLWSPLPNKLTADESWQRTLLRYVIAAWYLAVYAAALVGVWRLRDKLPRSPWVWGVLLCLVFTGVHTFYWSNLRMRAPLMPFVAFLASVGACSVANVLRRGSLTEARRRRVEKK